MRGMRDAPCLWRRRGEAKVHTPSKVLFPFQLPPPFPTKEGRRTCGPPEQESRECAGNNIAISGARSSNKQ